VGPRSSKPLTSALISAVALGLLLSACGGTGAPKSTASVTKGSGGHTPLKGNALQTQAPVPAESNPPGDIPDSTAFVPYKSSSGQFKITVPEGWARRTKPSQVTFTSKLNQVDVRWGSRSSAKAEINVLGRKVPAFQLEKTSNVTLPGGPATLIQYQQNSKPNAVTGQQYRLERLQFDFVRASREAALTLSSTVGADNVDAWRTISESFRWR
jgi:hypothetical protein